MERPVSDFVIKKAGNANATISSAGAKIAEIKKEGAGYRLTHSDGSEWILSNNVHGEPRPFSYSVRRSKGKDGGKPPPGDDEVFVMRDQLFRHDGRFYMLANQPSGRHWSEHVQSPIRYIGRLDGFPYLDLEDVDYHNRDLRDKTKRLRGTPVGQASGLGIEETGHKVHVDKELEGAGLFIAAISYLIYAAA